uniref:Ribosomal protein S3 n=1 Tax=Didymium iridis TaxID=5793 RepID=D3X9X1_9MYCE|nr:ribosomal protein S3 [Didymium iridis]ADD25162.1 ribosomal protein S3 [Didymium iridis]
MGHKINPQIFRLGVSIDWNYQLRDPLLANVIVYKTVKNLFWKYSAPYVCNTISRKKKPTEFNLLNRKRSLIRNHFGKKGFIFSHLNISYAPSLHLSIVLFDTASERIRVEKKLREMPSYYLSGQYIYRKGRKFIFFLKNTLLDRSKHPIRPKYATRWYYYIRLLRKFHRPFKGPFVLQIKRRNTKLLFKKKVIRKLCRNFRRLNIKYYIVKFFFRKFVRVKPFPIWLINNSWIFSKRHRIVNFIMNLRICIFLLRYFKFYKRIYSKKKLFLFNVLIVSLASVMSFHQEYKKRFQFSLKKFKRINNIISRRIFLFLYLCHIQLLSFNYLQLQYNKQIFQRHLPTFHLFSKILLFTLRKAIFIPNDRRLITRFYIMNNLNLNADFLLNYFMIKLGQYFSLNEILSPILRRLKRLTDLDGFRIIFSGRLTRKERAAYIVRSHKSMPLSTYKAKIDYASGFKIMKFGVVGIKIYLLYTNAVPYYYFYEFRSKL